ncbi:MAG: hypothetical protein J5659_01640 [Clostridia bacterium]|nr:hypothetical protein [Clostridia bacterium]
MSVFTDNYLSKSNNNEERIIELLKRIDEKLDFLCGPEYKEKQNKKK